MQLLCKQNFSGLSYLGEAGQEMSGTTQRPAQTAVTERYEALFRVSQSLLSIRSSQELFSILARELRAVVNFYFFQVGIYDDRAPEPRLTLYGEPGVPLPVPPFSQEDTITWWVYQHQQPLIIPSLDAETRFPVVIEMLKTRGVRSVCALPLTAAHRRLGSLTLGSTETAVYSLQEVNFLSLVANQVALAVDDSLHFDASQQAKEALRASEERLRMIVDNIPGLVGTRAATGEPEFVNRQMLEFFGPSLEQLPDWSSLIHANDRERVINLWRRSIETGQPYDVEHRARRADGVFRWLHARGQPLRDAEGRIVRWCIMLTDVDDRKRAEEALRASELNFRVIIDSIPGLVHTLTATGELEFVNQQNLDYFGKTLEELRAWASNDVLHADDLPRAIQAWKHTLETGLPDEIECRLRRADGVYRWFQLRCLPLRDSEGRIIRWISLHTDIDERKQAEDRLQLLFDVSNQVVSNLQLRDLLRAVAGNIRRLMQCDCASLALPDEEEKQLRLHVLDFPEGKGFLQEEGFYSIEGSPYGAAFRTMKPLALGSPFAGWSDNPVVQSRISEGFKSLCFLPLISRNRPIGTLNLGRLRAVAFTDEDLSFLGQVASQIAIAVENTCAYNEITQARSELEKALGEIQRLKDRLQDENLVLREQIDQALMFEEIVGASAALRVVLSRVSKVAPTDSSVLLTGETGTGKELIARAIHKRSRRSSRAFVSVNCAAIPSSLIASELFGHEKGAFTGATQRRLGRFEFADEGTLFLDEVGELPAETQIALLRVLQEHEFERVGGNQPIRVDVRVIAATNRDLEAAIATGAFRGDLFYRLNVFPIEIPPLRERREDIPLLVEYFIGHFARKAGKSFRGINKKTLDLLLSYPWPGNIRELQNVVERSVIVCETENFSVDESWLSRRSLATTPKSRLELSRNLSAQEKEMIETALRESGGRVSGPSGAAAKLGIHRSTLESKITSLQINKHRFRTASGSKNS
jgi:formate hydrogenlyase transcriptional activator